MKVFLGGTCGKSTWRSDIIPMLDAKNIDYFNPVVDDWDDLAQKEEIKQREICDIVLYTITSEMEGVYSIAEVVDDSHKKPDRTVLCVLPEGFSEGSLKSLKQVSVMVERNGSKSFNNLEAVVDYLVEESEEVVDENQDYLVEEI